MVEYRKAGRTLGLSAQLVRDIVCAADNETDVINTCLPVRKLRRQLERLVKQ
jgi:prephenate dehydrogenase